MKLTKYFTRVSHKIDTHLFKDMDQALSLVQLYVQEREPHLLDGIGSIDPEYSAYGCYKTAEDDLTSDPTTPIHVNESKIDSQFKDPGQQLLSKARTIIHELTHRFEHLQFKSGKRPSDTNESGPQVAEDNLTSWVKQNLSRLVKLYPELSHLDL